MTYRGRAIPIAWKLLKHNSSAVGVKEIHPVLSSAYAFLCHLPEVEQVYFRADRGFMDRQLMVSVTGYGWKWAIRGKGQVYVYDAQGVALGQIRQHLSQHGKPVFLNDVYITQQHYGPVHLAIWHPPGARDPWFIVSNYPCSKDIFDEYAQRFQIEEGFLDLKSAGFDLESTHLRDTTALSGLIFLLALCSIFLFSEGASLVEEGERQAVDPHHRRRLSYFQLGRRAILSRLARRKPLLVKLRIPSTPDPEPLKTSRGPPASSTPRILS